MDSNMNDPNRTYRTDEQGFAFMGTISILLVIVFALPPLIIWHRQSSKQQVTTDMAVSYDAHVRTGIEFAEFHFYRQFPTHTALWRWTTPGTRNAQWTGSFTYKDVEISTSVEDVVVNERPFSEIVVHYQPPMHSPIQNDFQYRFRAVKLPDLNNDSYFDIVASGEPGNIVWLKNSKDGTFSKQSVIPYLEYPFALEVYDIDEDGLLDILAFPHENVNENWMLYYWKNIGSKSQPRFKQLPLTDTEGAQRKQVRCEYVEVADITHDGAARVGILLTASAHDPSSGIRWWEYDPATGGFLERYEFKSGTVNTQCFEAHVGQLNDDTGDGRIDSTDTPDIVACGGVGTNGWVSVWLQDPDSPGVFSDEIIVAVFTPPAHSIAIGDFDNDMDSDLVVVGKASSSGLNQVRWYENPGISWNTTTMGWNQRFITAEGMFPAEIVKTNDYNLDGHIDILASKCFNDDNETLIWWNRASRVDMDIDHGGDKSGFVDNAAEKDNIFSSTYAGRDVSLVSGDTGSNIIIENIDVNQDGFMDLIGAGSTGRLAKHRMAGAIWVHTNLPWKRMSTRLTVTAKSDKFKRTMVKWYSVTNRRLTDTHGVFVIDKPLTENIE